MVSVIETYREKNPGQPLEVRFLPRIIKLFVRGMDHYDPHFGNAFYDGSWHEGFDHAEALRRIDQPALLLHANYEIREDGVLNGAMSQQDADLAVSLLPHAWYRRIDSAHTVHLDKPEAFIRIVEAFFLREARSSSTGPE